MGTHRKVGNMTSECAVIRSKLVLSIARSGTRVRVTAQLVRASDDRHLWANTYERDFRDVLACDIRQFTSLPSFHLLSHSGIRTPGLNERLEADARNLTVPPRYFRMSWPESTGCERLTKIVDENRPLHQLRIAPPRVHTPHAPRSA
jgi:hypothetical protein